MRLIPKVEMQWTAPLVFVEAMKSCTNRIDSETLLLRLGLMFGSVLVSLKFFIVWMKTTFAVDSEAPVSMVRQLKFLPVWFLVGFLLAYVLQWLISMSPDTYRIVGGRIEIPGSKRRFAFETIERAKLRDFGAFRVLSLEVRDRGTVLWGAPADLDFEKLRSLFESRVVAFESTAMAAAWPGKTAIREFEGLVASTRSHAKAISKTKRDRDAGSPGAIVLLRSAVAITSLVGIMLALGHFFRRAYDDWNRQIVRFETMKEAVIEAKKAAGTDWPNVRQRHVGPFESQGRIMTAAGRRTLIWAYVAGIFSFVAMLGSVIVIMGTCFARFDDS